MPERILCLGSVTFSKIRKQCTEASRIPARRNGFRGKQLFAGPEYLRTSKMQRTSSLSCVSIRSLSQTSDSPEAALAAPTRVETTALWRSRQSDLIQSISLHRQLLCATSAVQDCLLLVQRTGPPWQTSYLLLKGYKQHCDTHQPCCVTLLPSLQSRLARYTGNQSTSDYTQGKESHKRHPGNNETV